ncbi:MAG: RNA methyltransferase [Bergeyella sp.]|nr:RNA methyltransferase [Bergeyella sp.]
MVESPQNQKIKKLTRLLSDNRFRRKEGIFVVEGKQENDRALRHGYRCVEYFICPGIFKDKITPFKEHRIHYITKNLYKKIAYRNTVEGILGVYKAINKKLNNFSASENSTIIVLESTEKPGNLGAILRSCEAFGVDALIIADPKIDLYNPNVIRSSVGCIFGMNVFQEKNTEIEHFLENNGYKIFTTFINKKSASVTETKFEGKNAIIFGTEHSGVSQYWQNKGTNINIPMIGSINSLNLSNAVAIICYECLKQKSQDTQS